MDSCQLEKCGRKITTGKISIKQPNKQQTTNTLPVTMQSTPSDYPNNRGSYLYGMIQLGESKAYTYNYSRYIIGAQPLDK